MKHRQIGSSTVRVERGSLGAISMYAECDIDVFVDVDALAKELAYRAFVAKSGKVTRCRGSVVVRCRNKREAS